MTTFPTRLRALRLAKSWSQVELARRMGVTALTAWRWEAGRAKPGLDVMQRLCETLGTSLDHLVSGKDAA